MSSEPIFVEAAMPTSSRALHMALTVRDMRVSADWDECVLGFGFVKEFEADPGDAGIPRIVLLHQHSGFLPGLCNLRAERAMPSIRCGRAWIRLATCALGRGIAELPGIAANGCPGRPMGPSASQRHLDGASEVSPERRG
jgi:hypothetical protein